MVCFDVHVNIVGETLDWDGKQLKNNSKLRWKLGSCSTSNTVTYMYVALYVERCCLESGRHTLVCYNDPPTQGWNNAYIIIQGNRYCDDFIGYSSFQTLTITGNNLNFLYYLRSMYVKV